MNAIATILKIHIETLFSSLKHMQLPNKWPLVRSPCKPIEVTNEELLFSQHVPLFTSFEAEPHFDVLLTKIDLDLLCHAPNQHNLLQQCWWTLGKK